MPRRNRPNDEDPPPLRLPQGAATEVRRGREWVVQPIQATAALKPYRCPGCGGEIPPGIAHVVAWRADGVLGAAADLDARRHWHTGCWRIS